MTATDLDQPFTETQTQLELDRLQGAWVTVAGRRPVQLLIAGRHFTARFLDGHLYMGSFHLFVEEEPREMVMWIEEGPEHHRGRIAHCIYFFENETLRWCATDPGSNGPVVPVAGTALHTSSRTRTCPGSCSATRCASSRSRSSSSRARSSSSRARAASSPSWTTGAPVRHNAASRRRLGTWLGPQPRLRGRCARSIPTASATIRPT